MSVQREIDLHNGSGVQVFKAESEAELIDQLVQAQTHATRKIRELSEDLKTVRKELAICQRVLSERPPVQAKTFPLTPSQVQTRNKILRAIKARHSSVPKAEVRTE